MPAGRDEERIVAVVFIRVQVVLDVFGDLDVHAADQVYDLPEAVEVEPHVIVNRIADQLGDRLAQ